MIDDMTHSTSRIYVNNECIHLIYRFSFRLCLNTRNDWVSTIETYEINTGKTYFVFRLLACRLYFTRIDAHENNSPPAFNTKVEIPICFLSAQFTETQNERFSITEISWKQSTSSKTYEIVLLFWWCKMVSFPLSRTGYN